MSHRSINHIALLVPSVEKAAEVARLAGLPVGAIEEFEGEGTREVYIGEAGQSTLLLLLEPIKEGPYLRAMTKRGPGLHHIAIDVLDVGEFADQLSGTGWLLHPQSLQTFAKTKTIWLARPGVPMLVEVQQRESFGPKPPFVQRLSMPMNDGSVKLLHALGVDQVIPAEKEHWLEFAETKIEVRSLW